jgi:hypothetical protein
MRTLPGLAALCLALPAQLGATELSTCAAIDKPITRLACYDQVAGRTEANHVAGWTIDTEVNRMTDQ